MLENHLRNLIREGKPTLGTRLQSSWPTVTELVGRSGKFDYVEFLAEYAPYDLYALDNLGRAIELFPNFTGMIKMEQMLQHYLAVRAMGAGIQNLMFTDVRSVDEAKKCVQIVKPETPEIGGMHGNAAGRAATGGLPAIVKQYDEAVIVLMIEKRGAVENLDAILDVPGIDLVQFGPSDYSMSIGQAGMRTSPEIVAAREFTIKCALKHGVRPRAELTEASEAQYYVDLGVKDFCMAADTTILSRYYADEGAKMREVIAKIA